MPTTSERPRQSGCCFRLRLGIAALATLPGGVPAALAQSPSPQATPAVVASTPARKTQVLWLDQSAFRITSPGGKVIMVDPWLGGNPKTPANFKPLHAVGKIDLILVTHAHADHFADAPALAKMHNAPV